MKRALPAFFVCAGLLLAQRPPIETAWDLLANGRRAEAVRVLEGIIRADKSHAEARIMLGSILTEDGKYTEAIPLLVEAVRLNGASADAHNALGDAYNGAKQTADARAEFEKAVRIDPRFAPARVSLGLILLEAGDFAGAAPHLDRAINLLGRSEESAFPRYLRAKIYSEHEQIDKAAAELAVAVELRPDFAEAWSDLGWARKTLLDDDGAFAAYKRSVELQPESPVARYRLGAEYLRRGDVSPAIVQLSKAFRLNPKDQSTLYSLQTALRQAGRVEEAAQVKAKLTALLRERDRESQSALQAVQLNNQGVALEKSGKLKEALEKYRSAVALDPEHAGIRVNFAAALLRVGVWQQGIAELRESIRRDPTNDKLKQALEEALKHAPASAR